MKFIRINWFILSIILLCVIASYISLQAIRTIQFSNHFTLLADAFIQGKLNIEFPPPWLNDLSYFNNKYYVPFGPIPAVLLVPLRFISGFSFSQHILALIALPLNFILLYRIGKAIGIRNDNDTLWITTAFIFGSIYIFLTLTNISAYLTQVVAITFLILALHEYFYKRRLSLIGLYIGLAGMTRPTLYLSSLFFLVELLIFFKSPIIKKIIMFLTLITPIVMSVFLLGGYNHIRFGKVFENGYNYNISNGEDLLRAKQKGFFSLAHIPGNVFLMLFKGPDPIREDAYSYVLKAPYLKINYWGLGLFFSSPFLIYLVSLNLRRKYVLSSSATILVMLVPIVTYYAYGAWQYSYRHALDFYPFLFLMLATVFKEKLPLMAKFLILYSIFWGFYFMFSIWSIYPLMKISIN